MISLKTMIVDWLIDRLIDWQLIDSWLIPKYGHKVFERCVWDFQGLLLSPPLTHCQWIVVSRSNSSRSAKPVRDWQKMPPLCVISCFQWISYRKFCFFLASTMVVPLIFSLNHGWELWFVADVGLGMLVQGEGLQTMVKVLIRRLTWDSLMGL